MYEQEANIPINNDLSKFVCRVDGVCNDGIDKHEDGGCGSSAFTFGCEGLEEYAEPDDV